MRGSIHINWRQDGPEDGPALVLLHPLGSDLRVFDGLLPLLPDDMRIIRIDMRGHGGSECPPPPYGMGTLIADTEKVFAELNLRDAVLLGVSIGGLIAQGLAFKRPELLRGLILSNTAPRIGIRTMWEKRIAEMQKADINQYAKDTFERWFGPLARRKADIGAVEKIVLQQRIEGIIGCAHAIAGTDFYTQTATLNLPVMCVAGDIDGSTPPDMVREMAALIEDARFELLRGAGHLPFVEKPDDYATLIRDFTRGLDVN
ncbi:hypothetical protein ACMU_09365 [Actibacterium mucosum KCTC 23349]|uniref:AB hydrolase-1 domain-containing protein n=1 Tax=Actibacterium mucosum KCTC 23349 TaxID=1454373 RepID=A0A037ZIP1_9RHOB|nr:alpha/beta fold hydrolase [Actibacterium mucosum]KAJ55963.1 hypothetical protein ACMU_09365 [Actibacterium mucosum KCTC 23349]